MKQVSESFYNALHENPVHRLPDVKGEHDMNITNSPKMSLYYH